MTLDFALARLTGVIEKLTVYPENMRANMDSLGGLIHSQRVLLALTQAGMSREDAYQAETRARAGLRALGAGVRPLLRDPADMPDLLSYQLISGMIAGTEEP